MMKIVGRVRHGYFGNIYSWGMDDLCAELNRATAEWVHFTLSGGDDPRLDQVASDAAFLAEIQAGATGIDIGHSLGADGLLRFARTAKAVGVKLPLACPVDPVCWDSDANAFIAGRWEVDDNVARVVGFASDTFPGGGRVFRAAGNTVTDVSDVQLALPHAVPRGMGIDIASAPAVHKAIIDAVLAVEAAVRQAATPQS